MPILTNLGSGGIIRPNKIISIAGKFVAVAYNSAVAAYSNDGINWVTTALPSSANWLSVTFG